MTYLLTTLKCATGALLVACTARALFNGQYMDAVLGTACVVLVVTALIGDKQ